MLSLIKIEWLKIKKYPAFWWMLGIVALTYPGTNAMAYVAYLKATTGKEITNNIAKMFLGNPFAFPETWHSVAYFSSFFILLPAILVIMMVTNEYTFRTHRQNIIDGWSRGQYITSKLFDVLIIALDDLAYQPGALYEKVSPLHVLSALVAATMTGAVIVALSYRPVSRVWHVASWASLALLALYVLNAGLQFMHGH